MDDFDLEKFLDNVGVQMAPNGLSAQDTEYIITNEAKKKNRLIGQLVQKTETKTPKLLADQKKWQNKQLFKPCSLLKTKIVFPLSFLCKTSTEIWDGAVYDQSEDLNTRQFDLQKSITIMMLDEGVLRVSRRGVGTLVDKTNPEAEVRFIKALAVFNEENGPRIKPHISPTGLGVPGRVHTGPGMFYLLFDRNTTKKQAERYLFEVLQEGSAPRGGLKSQNFTNKLYLELRLTSANDS